MSDRMTSTKIDILTNADHHVVMIARMSTSLVTDARSVRAAKMRRFERKILAQDYSKELGFFAGLFEVWRCARCFHP